MTTANDTQPPVPEAWKVDPEAWDQPPEEWEQTPASRVFRDNMAFGEDEDALIRVPGDPVRFARCDLDEVDDPARWAYLPDWVALGPDPTPRAIQQAFDRLEAWVAPHIKAAHAEGRLRGREEIRDVLRDLVGPATARNVMGGA